MFRSNRILLLVPALLAACASDDAPQNLKSGATNAAAPATTVVELEAQGEQPMTTAEAEAVVADIVSNTPRLTDNIDALQVIDTEVDNRGLAHVRFQQTHEGVPVFGAEAFVHTDAAGVLFRMSDTLHRDIRVDVSPAHTDTAAIEAARSTLHPRVQDVEAPTASLFVLRHDGADHLAWKVGMYVEDPQEGVSQPVIFIDAHTLEPITSWNNLKETALSDSDKVTYDMNNSTRTNRAAVGDSSDSELNTTHNAVGTTLDFLSTNFGRDSYDDNGAVVRSYGHYSRNYVNAYWDGQRLVFGDGDGYNANYLGVLDVTAHEFGHAVTDREANLTYSYESGALNEAASDILAAAVEAYQDGATGQDTWDVGEDCWLADRALRFMQSPSDDGASYDYYPARYTGSSDNGGVHWNSGIANHFFYLLAEGGQHHNSAYRSGNTVAGIGIDDAYAIWYEALTNYMTSSTNFSGARTATESACAALGYATATCDSVSYAWYEVGVGSNPGSGSGSTGGGSTGGGSTGGGTDTADTGDTGDTGGSGTGGGCPSGYAELTGTLSSGADDQFSYSAGSGTHDFLLTGPSSADFDLYLYKKKGKSYRTVDSSTNAGSTESISYTDSSGSFVVQVVSYSGSGDYSLCYVIP